MPKVTRRLTRSSRTSTASRRIQGDNHTRGHTSRRHRLSLASRSISSDSSFSMALPSSQAVSSAVSAAPAQLTLLEDLLSYIRAEVQRTVSQSTLIAATHDASPPPSSQHSSLPQPQPASAAGVSVGMSYMYIYHVHGNLQGSIFLLQAFLYPMHVCYAVRLLASHMYWYMYLAHVLLSVSHHWQLGHRQCMSHRGNMCIHRTGIIPQV